MGAVEGRDVGEAVGQFVAPSMVGLLVIGMRVGSPEGIVDGAAVGPELGCPVG